MVISQDEKGNPGMSYFCFNTVSVLKAAVFLQRATEEVNNVFESAILLEIFRQEDDIDI